MNHNPSTRQVEAMRDVLKFPDSTLRERGVRLGVAHSAVVALLRQCERRTFVAQVGTKWVITKLGRAWLYPTMPTRRTA